MTTVMQSYGEFLAGKRFVAPACGKVASESRFPQGMFKFQRDLVTWSLRKGRAAIFADTGLGKTVMQLTWARQAADRTLILAPLAVARQTVTEGAKWGFDVRYCRNQGDASDDGITITNYEMLDSFDMAGFGAVVLDESSILKNFEGKIRTRLIESCRNVPMRLCCTATPAPNDISEIANHAEFLGLMTRAEMLAAFFVHDDKGWRLKGHAREPFYAWLASWGMSVKRPSDLGYSDEGFDLPELIIEPAIVESDYKPDGFLFPVKLSGVTERASLRRSTIKARVAKAVKIIESEPDEQWLIWCGLNDESDALAKALPDATVVSGSDSDEHKESALLGFGKGDIVRLITKPKIAGFGMNWQRCARMIFVGIGDSYESYYQSIRRCWRFGQTRKVKVCIVLSDAEYSIYENVLRKEREADLSSRSLVEHVREYERVEIQNASGRLDYVANQEIQLPAWI